MSVFLPVTFQWTSKSTWQSYKKRFGNRFEQEEDLNRDRDTRKSWTPEYEEDVPNLDLSFLFWLPNLLLPLCRTE